MNELKKIKKLYGETGMRYCRDNFHVLLDTPGLLIKTLNEKIHSRKSFFKDLLEAGDNEISKFKTFIYDSAEVEVGSSESEAPAKAAKELLDEAGYILYECETPDDVDSFKKYYRGDELLCTFNDSEGRLRTCRIFWIVKKSIVDDIEALDDKREMRRDDEYGTSCCSIQFSKRGNYLSIKNRYNHKASNCDATFSNNLDNIITGLTEAFKNDYNIEFDTNNSSLNILGYTYLNGKMYKYNREISGRYFGDDFYQNADGQVVTLDTNIEKIIGDHFLLNFKEKSLFNLLENNTDLDMTFDKIIVMGEAEYDEAEDEPGVLKICFTKK